MVKIQTPIYLIAITTTVVASCITNSNENTSLTDSSEQTVSKESAASTVESSATVKVQNNATCSEKESENQNDGGPISTKTCLYRNYKSISTGYPDYKGRYTYDYLLFKKQENGTYLQIKNAKLFNENKRELLSIINSKIEKDYNTYFNDPETADCFDGASFRPFEFDQLGIDFDEDHINFHVTFGLSSACMSVDGTIISFTLDEIQKYLNL